MDWTLAHHVNAVVATHDVIDDPVDGVRGGRLAALRARDASALASRPPVRARARWKVACVSALASAGVALLADQAIGHLWDRARPFAAHPDTVHLLSGPSTDPSFPSDHAAAAFAIGFAVYAFSRPVGAAFLTAAGAIAISRVAVGLHYPSDVLAGATVGWAAAQLVVRLGRPWVLHTVSLASRATDPVLARIRPA